MFRYIFRRSKMKNHFVLQKLFSTDYDHQKIIIPETKAMDGQKIPKLNISKNRRRFKNCSSFSLAKENLELHQLLEDENMMVNILLKVSNDSEKPPKMEKIPLNGKDLYRVLEKLATYSEEEKVQRRILKPGMKRKHRLCYHKSQEKLTVNGEKDSLDNQSSEERTKLTALRKFIETSTKVPNMSDLNVIKNWKRKDENNFFIPDNEDNKCPVSNQFNQCSDLTVLYSRNMISKTPKPQQTLNERKMVSKGMNTDIAQTPRLLEDILRALNMNVNFSALNDRSNDKIKSEDKTESSLSKGREKCSKCCMCSHGSCSNMRMSDDSEYSPSPLRNFLLVPFIVSNVLDEKRTFEEKNKSNFDQIFNCGRFTHTQMLPEKINVIRSQKSLMDTREGANPSNVHLNTISEIKMQYKLKNKNTYDRKSTSNESDDEINPNIHKSQCFLEEMKYLQMRINTIVKILEVNGFMTCQHICCLRADGKHENTCFACSNHLEEYTKLVNSSFQEPSLNWQTPKKNDSIPILGFQSSQLNSDVKYFNDHKSVVEDLKVQRAVTKSASVLINRATSPSMNRFSCSDTVKNQGELLVLNKLSQCPSLEDPARDCSSHRSAAVGRLILSKSFPLCLLDEERGTVGTVVVKTTSSEISCAKNGRGISCFQLVKDNFEFHRKLKPQLRDVFEERKHSVNHSDVSFNSEKADKKDMTKKKKTEISELHIENGQSKEGPLNLKCTRKVAKITILGNGSVFVRNNRETELGRINVQVEEQSKLKISNRFTRKPKLCNFKGSNSNTAKEIEKKTSVQGVKTDNSGRINKSNLTNASVNPKKNVDSQIPRQTKTSENNSRSKIETKSEDFPPADSLQPNQKAIKGRRQTTDVHTIPRGKEIGLNSGSRGTRISNLKIPSLSYGKNSPVEGKKSSQKVIVCDNNFLAGEKVNMRGKSSEMPVVRDSSNNIKVVTSNESAKTFVHSTAMNPRDSENNEKNNTEGYSQAVKSIWALTKVMLYRDGSQTYEVLETSSSPLRYHINIIENNIDKNDNDINNGNDNATNNNTIDYVRNYVSGEESR